MILLKQKYYLGFITAKRQWLDVPERHETVQIMACVVGFGLSGVENQKSDSELGKNRSFKYEDMTAYIRDRIYPYIEVI